MAPCVASVAWLPMRENQTIKLSALLEQLTEEAREAGRSLMKREKSTGPRRILAEHRGGLEWSNLCDFEKTSQARLSERKRLSPTYKARTEASRNQFMEKRKSTVARIVRKPRSSLLKPIRNRVTKEQNLVESRSIRAELA